MSENTTLRDLFDRWESIWHEARFDLVPECVTSGTMKLATEP
ncbi:hypothetical protein BX604_4998 [Burkholderia sp. JKS000303]|nr:hypothetical protein BX604_4998 [Burkholderia sp. JKS000303]